jgi:hypothetical protein
MNQYKRKDNMKDKEKKGDIRTFKLIIAISMVITLFVVVTDGGVVGVE